ncbi:flagellin N-terminal helical domain-containing protein [Cronobacter sakazakii]|uniref:flagellin N-terminal helical domain-containing protein n=1 Tax=Cronobacter sakazakii TaxID=28141 RepID=UPI000948D513|nr:flagellin [Cronobacter sakazakii]PUX33988.1 flagellin [Cronobacter sakazakii]PUX54416.1 flagellin [Cronobacter sakazakii]PUX56493.1 flagellin [Cronobacter sakazakii]PUX65084.1 flagellin [Cronobacter sakazakii]
MATIFNNLMSGNVLTQQKKTAASLSQSIERLSSGMRINSAKDDAAGQAIANRMSATLRANDVASRSMNDGISLSQTAEGALSEVTDLLTRAKSLAVQSATGTLDASDRAAISAEFSEIKAQIDAISTGTTIFGKYPLAPAASPPPPASQLGNIPSINQRFPVPGQQYTFTSGLVPLAYIPAGATDITLTINSGWMDDDIQLFSRDGSHLVGTPVNGPTRDFTWTNNGVNSTATANTKIISTDNGFLPGASYSDANLTQGPPTYNVSGGAVKQYNGMTITYSGDGDRYETPATGWANNGTVSPGNYLERLSIDKVTEDVIIMVVGNGSFYGEMTWTKLPKPTDPPDNGPVSTDTDIVMSADYGEAVQYKTIPGTPSDTKTLGLDTARLDNQQSASQAIDAIDHAIDTVSAYRGTYGSLVNTFDSAKEAMAQKTVATTAARSRIEDADFAQEASNLRRTQILQQAGNAVLAQANQQAESVLSLLK